MLTKAEDLKGLKITIMGLGINGGGLNSALFCLKQGAKVCITDLRPAEKLKSSIEALSGYSYQARWGEHREEDFTQADLIIKNPAVPASSPYLKLAKHIESDISLFLRFSSSPLIAVTGSKGKSSTSSAIHFALKKLYPGAKLGGNITVSPLSFLEELSTDDPVVLELSSWQLADLKDKGLLKPKSAIITNILPDHQDRYSSMQQYAADKKLIFADMDSNDTLVCLYDDWGSEFAKESKARVLFFSKSPLPPQLDGAYLDEKEAIYQIKEEKGNFLDQELKIAGDHQRLNLCAAALALSALDISLEKSTELLSDFRGIAHRLELVTEINNVKFINDTAATIPQAMAAALQSFSQKVHIICGGTDKKLDFSPALKDLKTAASIHLLAGTASDKLIPMLESAGMTYSGPFQTMSGALDSAYQKAEGDSVVLLSPGCASFGLFLNEFDRGNQFRDYAKKLAAKG